MQRAKAEKKSCQSVVFSQINLAFMTCMVMYSNGVVIGIANIFLTIKPTPKVHQLVLKELLEEVVGVMLLKFADQLIE